MRLSIPDGLIPGFKKPRFEVRDWESMTYPEDCWGSSDTTICEWKGLIHNRKDDAWYFMRTRERALNARCMINGYMPVSFRELVQNNERYKRENSGEDACHTGTAGRK